MRYQNASTFPTDCHTTNMNNRQDIEFKNSKFDPQRTAPQQQCEQSSVCEGMVLKEVREMKKLLCQMANKNGGNSTTQGRNCAILQHIQDTVNKLIEQSGEMSPEEVTKLLNSVSANITKLQSPNPDADNINTAVNNLKKHIKCLNPEAILIGNDLETQMKSILTNLQDILKCNPPYSDRMDKIARNLKAICCSLKRQCSKGNKIVADIKEVQELFRRFGEPKISVHKQTFRESTNMSSNLNENQNNLSAQCPVELLETPVIKNLIQQIMDEIRHLQPEKNFGDHCLDDRIICLMEAIRDTRKSGFVEKVAAEKFSNLLSNLECEVCKQCQCESESIAKIHEVLGELRCQSSTNQSSAVKTSSKTSEPVSFLTQIRRFVGHIRPETRFNNAEPQTVPPNNPQYTQDITQAGYGDFGVMRAVRTLLEKPKFKTNKLEGSIQEVHAAMASASPQHRPSLFGAFQVDTNQSSDVEGGKLNETQHLKCLVHHLKKFIKKYNGNIQFPDCDFYTLVNSILDAVITITASNCLDDETKGHLLKIMKCLETEIRLQCDTTCLIKKINQIRDNIADKVNAGSNECGGGSIDPAELIRCLTHHLKKIVLKARPSIQIQESDQGSQLPCLLNSLNEILQSDRIDQETRGKLPKMMRCLQYSLSKLGKLTPELTAKIQDISQLLRSDGCQSCADLNQPQLKITSTIMSLAKQLKGIIQTIAPNANVPECTSEAALNTLMDSLIQALRSGVCENNKRILENILTGLQKEIGSQGLPASSLLKKINSALGMLKSGGQSTVISAETPDLIAITSVMLRFLQRTKPNLQIQGLDLPTTLHTILDNLLALSGASCTAEVTDALSCLLPALDKILCKQGQSELKEKVRKLEQIQSRRRSDYSIQDPLKGDQIGCLMRQLNDLILLIYPDLIIPQCTIELKAMFFAAVLRELAKKGPCDSDKIMQIKSLIPKLVCALKTAGADEALIQDFEELEAMLPARSVRGSQLARTSDGLSLRELISKNISTMNDCIQQLESAMRKYGLD